MRIVLDTNILLVSLPLSSPYRPIFDALLKGKFTLIVSTEIIFEYLEVIGQQTRPDIAENVIKTLLNLHNLARQEVYFKWGLIQKDYDDNKFVDSYLAGKGDYLVTEDHHFSILKGQDFPQVNLLRIDEFLDLIRSNPY